MQVVEQVGGNLLLLLLPLQLASDLVLNETIWATLAPTPVVLDRDLTVR